MSCNSCCKPVYVCQCPTKQRGCAGILLDFFLVVATGGLWIIWILIREMRNH